MADITREMEDFEAANRTFGGEWKLERKGTFSISSPDHQVSSDLLHANTNNNNSPSPAPAPRPVHVHVSTTTTHNNAASNKQRNYNNYNSHVTWTIINSELKRQRRVLKYKSYAVETRLKASVMNGYRWVKRYCEYLRDARSQIAIIKKRC